MSIFKKIFQQKKICVTHNGTFHADDLFATATLSILNDGAIKVIRTRDEEIMKRADYVYDVGGFNDASKNLFDHHQRGGAGVRDNGIPYASFGLVWKAYGEEICGDKEIALHIENKIVLSIDARDSGVDISKPLVPNVFPYSVESIFLSEIPTWKEASQDIDKIFSKQLKKAVELLKREIKIAKDDIDGIQALRQAYQQAEDKRLVVADNDFPRYLLQNTLSRLPEPLYLIYPSSNQKTWKVEAIKKSPETMESRKYFPESWRGLMEKDGKLKEVTGVSDAMFCHQNGFYLTVGSKEGAIKLAQMAIIA